jgi:hypothetical protein
VCRRLGSRPAGSLGIHHPADSSRTLSRRVERQVANPHFALVLKPVSLSSAYVRTENEHLALPQQLGL